MYTDMEQWVEIRRRVFVDGESKRSVCRQFGIHWDTLKKILKHSEPPGYRLRNRGADEAAPTASAKSAETAKEKVATTTK